MAISAEQISKVLAEIQASVPAILKKKAFSEAKAYPTVEFVVDEALKSDKIDPEKKAKLQTLKDSGEFSKMKIVENYKVQKQIDNFVNRAINKAIKEGRLPPKSEIKNLPHVKEIYKIVNKQHDEQIQDKKD